VIDDVIGVNIFSARLDEMVAFYRDVLELPVHSDHGDLVAFELRPGMRLNIGRHSQVWADRNMDAYRIMINLGTSDIHATHERLASRGVTFIRPPDQEGWGGWIATFQDPDGNVLQLMQQPSVGE
jgi:predicted enzyme related to lactoylglutathione lyase